jgi:hypothetical protein
MLPFEKVECTDQDALGGGSRHQHVPSRWVRPVDAFGWHRIVLRHVIAGLTIPLGVSPLGASAKYSRG